MYILSPFKPQPLPIGDIPTHIFQSASPHRSSPVLIDAETDQAYTVNDIITKSHQLAAGLWRLGITNRVISVYGSDLQCVFVYYASLLSGNAYQTLGNKGITKEQLSDSDTAAVFVEASHVHKVETAAAGLEIKIVAFGLGTHNCEILEDLLADDDGFVPVRITSKKDAMQTLAMLACSRQQPKTVMLSHYGVLSAQRLGSKAGNGRTVVSAVPFDGMHGIGNVAHFPILSGAKVVQLREFDAHACLKAIDKYRPSVLLATHELLLDIYEAATRTAMGSLKLLGSEGQGFSADSVQVIFLREFRAPNAFKQKLAALFQARLVELYGYTETGLVAGVIAECPALPDSVGLLCPNVTARIVLDGRDLEAGQCGEILVKTPRLMMGYLGQQGTNSLDDGFFRTGDFGTVTESGVVVVKARFQDVIRLESGYVTPGEIEEEVRSRLKVSDCSVIKVKRESGFDAPFVFVARDGADGLDTSVAELIASFENMYPGIRGRLVDAIPRTTTGEVARSELMSLL